MYIKKNKAIKRLVRLENAFIAVSLLGVIATLIVVVTLPAEVLKPISIPLLASEAIYLFALVMAVVFELIERRFKKKNKLVDSINLKLCGYARTGIPNDKSQFVLNKDDVDRRTYFWVFRPGVFRVDFPLSVEMTRIEVQVDRLKKLTDPYSGVYEPVTLKDLRKFDSVLPAFPPPFRTNEFPEVLGAMM